MAIDWKTAELSEMDRALCRFAAKLTHRQTEVSAADIAQLRDVGLDDRAVHDAVQIIALFNYYPRVAHGLGVELEAESLVRPWGEGRGRAES